MNPPLLYHDIVSLIIIWVLAPCNSLFCYFILILPCSLSWSGPHSPLDGQAFSSPLQIYHE